MFLIRRSRPTTTSGSCRWKPVSSTWRTLSPTSNSLLLVWKIHRHIHHCIDIMIKMIRRQDKRAFCVQRHWGTNGEVRLEWEQMWKWKILQVPPHSCTELPQWISGMRWTYPRTTSLGSTTWPSAPPPPVAHLSIPGLRLTSRTPAAGRCLVQIANHEKNSNPEINLRNTLQKYNHAKKTCDDGAKEKNCEDDESIILIGGW